MSDNNGLVISENNTHDVIKEVQDAFYDIPFDNSAFQTENFVIAAQITPERAYRAIGLRMIKKLIAVQEAILAKEQGQIDADELSEKIESSDYNKFEKRRFELNLKKRSIYLEFNDKLLKDSIEELNLLYKHFKALPRYTREQFEAGEKRHYLEDLNRQVIGITGAKQSLVNMFDDISSIEKFEKDFKMIADKYDSKMLLELTEKSLTNVEKSQSEE